MTDDKLYAPAQQVADAPPPPPRPTTPAAQQPQDRPEADAEVEETLETAPDAQWVEDDRGDPPDPEEAPADAAPVRQTAEERAADIPKAAEDYQIRGEGLRADDLIVQGVQRKAHALGISNREFGELSEAFAMEAAQAMRQRLDTDRVEHTQMLGAVRQVWGNDAPANKSAFSAVLASLPRDLNAGLREARIGPNGPLLLNDPRFIELFVELGHLRRGGTGRTEERIAEIEHIRRTDWDQYISRGLDRKLAQLETAKARAHAMKGERPRKSDEVRKEEILKVMHTDFDEYKRRKLDKELAGILERAQG